MFNYPVTGEYPLVKALERQRKRVRHRFHVPAHAAEPHRCRGYEYDFTELPGLDNLYKPAGVIAESQEMSARFFGAEETIYLVNGSSAGLIAAILALCRPGEKVLLARNIHRSVITGLVWSGAVPCFIPITDFTKGIPLNINPAGTQSALKKDEKSGTPPGHFPEDIRALVVTAPSYWGVSPDLDALGRITGERNIPLIVDEAHGGHFIFHEAFPCSAAGCRADLWVNSAHKTLGALTPGALLHRRGKRADVARLKNALSMLQTSSPSYAVLASLDLLRENCAGNWEETIELAGCARRQISQIQGFACLRSDDLPAGFSLDPLRLTVFTGELTLNGFEVTALLRDDYGIEVEMTGPDYFVAVMHRGHQKQDIDALIRALRAAGKDYYKKGKKTAYRNESYPLPELSLSPRQAAESPWREIPLEEACGSVAAVTVSPFPPGIPVLIPGELIRAETVEKITADYRNGSFFLGLGEADKTATITVVDM